VEVLKDALFRVELPNRHRVVARVAGKVRATGFQALPGDEVTVEMSPFDLSKGRITAGRKI
jgi:translation initiation factor IF-1